MPICRSAGSVGLGIDDPVVWDVTVLTNSRDRRLDGGIAREFLAAAVLSRPDVRGLLPDEPCSVDGPLIQAWAGMKGFRPKDGARGRAASAGAQRRA